MPVGLIKWTRYLIKCPQASNIWAHVQTNSRWNVQKVKKCQHEAIEIDEVKWRNKLGTICLQKSTIVRYYFSSILKIYVRQIKYLEMNKTKRFKGEKLVYILIGGEIWLYKENQIKWSNIVMLSLMHAYLLWIY